MAKSTSVFVPFILALSLRGIARAGRSWSIINTLHHEVNKLNNFNWTEWNEVEPGSVTKAWKESSAI